MGSNILPNRLGITKQIELSKAEEKISKQKAKNSLTLEILKKWRLVSFQAWRLCITIFFVIFMTLQEKLEMSIYPKVILDLLL